jgi:hypothetical protein
MNPQFMVGSLTQFFEFLEPLLRVKPSLMIFGTTGQVKTGKLDCNEEVLESQADWGLTGWNLGGCGSLFLEPETSEYQ